MKWIGYFIVVGTFMSCNIRNEETVEVPQLRKTDSAIVTIPDTSQIAEVTRISKTAKPLLIARGSEPGWYAEFFADHLRLLIENGTDSLILENDFSGADNDSYSKTIPENALSISVNDKPCTEETSGEKRERSISIKYNKKTYKGCATTNVN
ncbi:MAG: hypothetical protein JNJ41_01560 [Bacteroidia bacterium]|nr:hypothetical protein [Bacteroidia bacterium]